MTAPSARLVVRESVPAGLTSADHARLWQLARRLQECDTVAEGETVAAEATSMGRDGPPAFVQAIAEIVGPALTSLRERERLRSLVIRDPLTGLFNRRFLEAELDRRIDHVRGRRRPLAVAVLDVDHFRDYNERHGHLAGDLLLQLVGLLLQGFRRGDDVPCRYGGDEFVLLMPALDAAAAVRRLEPLRETLAATAARHEGRPLPPVTASIGVAEFPDHAVTAAGLFESADRAMYRAKRAGRNRICLAGHE